MARAKETSVELAEGVQLDMRYDFNAICNVEDLTGKNLLEAGALDGVTGAVVRALVYGCHLAYHQARDEKPRYNLYGIGSLIDSDNAVRLLAAVKELSGQAEEEEASTEGGPTEAPVAVS